MQTSIASKTFAITENELTRLSIIKIALSEAIVRGGEAITPFVKLLMRFSDDYKYPMWLAIEERVRQYVIVDNNYLSNRPPYDKRPNFVEKGRIIKQFRQQKIDKLDNPSFIPIYRPNKSHEVFFRAMRKFPCFRLSFYHQLYEHLCSKEFTSTVNGFTS